MKLYGCKPHSDCEWSMMVAANSVREAKQIARGTFPSDEGADYIEMHVRLVRQVTVPESISSPQVFETCDGNEAWICAAWGFHEEMCWGCTRYREKHAVWVADAEFE